MTHVLTILDLTDADVPTEHWRLSGPTVGVCRSGVIGSDRADRVVDRATFTLTDTPSDDRRLVYTADIEGTIAVLTDRISAHPVAASVGDDVLRAVSDAGSTVSGLITESLAYSALQAGTEFTDWLASQGSRRRHQQDDAVVLTREDSHLDIVFNRGDRHNAFSDVLRAGLIDGLTVALADTSIESVRLSGRGRSFCSGGDLAEFGLFADPANSHLARTRHSPALLLDALTSRLGTACRADVHGAVLGSGLEMAAYCGFITARPDARFGLPELELGLVPGAGGTLSVQRRIGRWRTAYLLMTGRCIDATTALQWGLVDHVDELPAPSPAS